MIITVTPFENPSSHRVDFYRAVTDEGVKFVIEPAETASERDGVKIAEPGRWVMRRVFAGEAPGSRGYTYLADGCASEREEVSALAETIGPKAAVRWAGSGVSVAADDEAPRCELFSTEHGETPPPAAVRVRLSWALLSGEGARTAEKDLCADCYADKHREFTDDDPTRIGPASIKILTRYTQS